MEFKEFGFVDELNDGLEAMQFLHPTPIQEQAIPKILEGRDLLCCAQTGTGKTAAFLLPIINRLTQEPSDKVDTLIIVPTRELAVQIDQALEGFSYFTPVGAMSIYGGRDGKAMEQEKKALKQGAEMIIATPGRLKSHIDMGYVDFSQLKFLVLDEADRMLDMGFAPDIMHIVNALPKERQTLLFSATMPNEIRKFGKQLLKDPEEITIAVSKPAENIMQAAYEVSDEGKVPLTQYLLEGKKNLSRVIIFAGSKMRVKELASGLQRCGLQAEAISSDLEQDQREDRLRRFRSGSLPIVVATDVLSRGIDIKGIDLVINADVPGDAEDYVHRIGRTARAKASGIALTFINGKDKGRFRRIENLIDIEVRRLPLPESLQEYVPARYTGGNSRRGGSSRKSGRRGNPLKSRNANQRNSRKG